MDHSKLRRGKQCWYTLVSSYLVILDCILSNSLAGYRIGGDQRWASTGRLYRLDNPTSHSHTPAAELHSESDLRGELFECPHNNAHNNDYKFRRSRRPWLDKCSTATLRRWPTSHGNATRRSLSTRSAITPTTFPSALDFNWPMYLLI